MTDEASPEPGEARKTQILKGLADMALLSLLKTGPRYGLEILEGLRSEAGLSLAEGTIYPLLHRLERAGLVAAEWKLDEPGARPRKYYALTNDGRTELKALHAEWRRISGHLTAFLERGSK